MSVPFRPSKVAMPLLEQAKSDQDAKKPQYWFGYLPVWSECVPLDDNGKIDLTSTSANCIAAIIIGIRQGLSAIVSATLVFTSSGDSRVTEMFPFGISMMWWSTALGSAYYALFGRLQYNTNATQEVCAILYGAMSRGAAIQLSDTPERIAPTVLVLIVVSTVFTGVCTFCLGRLGLGSLMLSFPTPVTGGFLGCIGWFLVKTAIEVSSGVKLCYFYPSDFDAFFATKSLAPFCCLLGMVWFMREGPGMLKKRFPDSQVIGKLGGLICQLLPLAVFFVVILVVGVSMDDVSDAGWTYPAQAGKEFTSLWTSYRWSDADFNVVFSQLPNMFSLVLMTVLCTMTGVLGITGAFQGGPRGDPSPMETTNFDMELTVVGLGAVVSGLTNGVICFHRLGSSIQLRRDGGTHRIAVLTSAVFVALFFFSSVPLGHFIPKWFLGGLFMGSGVSFLEGAFKSYRGLPPLYMVGRRLPSPQYWVTVCCIVVAVFSSPFMGIAAGLAFSIFLFLADSAKANPINSISDGANTVSRTLKPHWELQTLMEQGTRIVVIYLQGQLFFGSGNGLAAAIENIIEAQHGHIRYIILSFAKVPAVDASAASQLKPALKRVENHGCKVVCCRMNKEVFDALSSAKLIQAPDDDCRKVMEAKTVETVTEDPEAPDQGTFAQTLDRVPLHEEGPTAPSLWRTVSFRPLHTKKFDAFDTESDALDYCGDVIIAEFTYAPQKELPAAQRTLKPYMDAFHNACTTGAPLTEEFYEQINALPPGTMSKVKFYCKVMSGLSPGHTLQKGSLYFIMQGGIGLVDVLHDDQSEDDDGIRPTTSLAAHMKVNMKMYYGRGQKRLRKRYPPGQVAGKTTFFTQQTREKIQSDNHVTWLITSAKFGVSVEVWALSPEQWEKMPATLRDTLTELLFRMIIRESEHSLLSGT